ncbi:MAG: hypothetical protein NFCOHLIN_02420 [Gammaproteobacteria bacterium]|nr:hypothetical protein [Gammaproteobacteria bacterium]
MCLAFRLAAASACLEIVAMLLPPPAAAAASRFEGMWHSKTTVARDHGLAGATTLALRQYGNVVCGEWSEGIGTGRLLGGNLVGRVHGRRMNARIGEEIYWARGAEFPNQGSEPALFVLQGRELAWYVRDDAGRLVKQQAFVRAGDRGSANPVNVEFTDRRFARLCPTGTDFVSPN